MTLVQSIWQILRCQHHNALLVFTPVLMTANGNRRVLARAAQEAIAQVLQTIGTTRKTDTRQEAFAFQHTMLSSQSAYALLVDLNQLPK
jgi:hypothetical protein